MRPLLLQSIASIVLLSTPSFAIASEWQFLGQNNARVQNNTSELITYCDHGDNGLRPERLYLYIKGQDIKNVFPKGPNYVRITQGNGSPYNTYVNAEWDQGGWVISFPANKIVERLKAGSQISFLPQQQNHKLTFSLKGSAKALKTCFQEEQQTQSVSTHSKVDIIGLKTGMTYKQFVESLPNKFNKKFSNLRDSRITFFGESGAAGTTVNFKGSGFWQRREKDLTEHIAITLAPDFLSNRITTIKRSLSYETYRNDSTAPLTNQVLAALKKKYGAPYWERKPTSQRKTGEMLFVFGKNETKSWFTTEPYPCERGLKLNGPQWGSVGSNKNMVQFGKQYGNLTDERCGPYIKVTYSSDGALLRKFSTTLVDVPLINDLMLEAFLTLQAETQQKEKAVNQNASGNTPKL